MTVPPILVRTRTYWREILIALLLIGLVVLSLMTCQYSKKGVSSQHQATIDSLRATQPAFDSTQLVARRTEDAHIAAAADLARATARLSAIAAQQRRLADSLGAAQQWQAAYYARTREADSLRSAVDTANARADRERAARLQADRRAALDSARHVAIQQLALGLERDANRAANCRIVRIIPCATRTQTFVVGAVLGTVGTYVVTSRRP